MFMSSLLGRDRLGPRAGLAVLLATAIALSGCGSQASDQEIAEALRGPAAGTAVSGAGLPGEAGAVPGDGSTAAIPAAPDATGPVQPGTAVTGTASGSGGPSAVTGGSQSQSQGSKKSASQGSKGSAAGSNSPSAPSVPTAANKSAVTIATLGTFTGILGTVLEGSPRTIAAWVQYTNAHGGLNGHPIKYIVADDQGDAATSLTLAKRLVENDRIIAMVGNIMAFGFDGVEQYMRSKNIPMIGGESINKGWTTSPIAFPTTPQVGLQIAAGFKQFVDQGKTKFGMLYCLEVSALCTQLKDEVKASPVGKYLTETQQVSLAAPSYTSQCLRLKQAGIEVLSTIMDTAGASRVVKDCATQGYKPQIVLAAIDATKDMPRTPGLENALIPAGVVSPATPGIPGLVKYREIMSTYGAKVGDSGFGMHGYTSAELLLVVSKGLSDAPSPAELLVALRKVKNETLGGMVAGFTFGTGKAVTTKPCVFLWGVSGGKFSAPQGAKQFCI